jgi:hypothetical protein
MAAISKGQFDSPTIVVGISDGTGTVRRVITVNGLARTLQLIRRLTTRGYQIAGAHAPSEAGMDIVLIC